MARKHAFVTGATGYIGRAAVAAFLAADWSVTALVRGAGADWPAGVSRVVGTLDDVREWGAVAKTCDVVVNLAFPSHAAGWFAAVEAEATYLTALADVLRGGRARLLLANGTAFLGDDGGGRHAPSAPIDPAHPAAVRAANTAPASYPGLSVTELRLASFIYGAGGSVFLPVLLAEARRSGESLCVGDGDARASTLDVRAAGRACVAAAERGRAGATYHVAGDEEPRVRDIAHAVAIAAGARVRHVDAEEAARRLDPFTAAFLTLNNRLDSSLARAELGWSGATDVPLLWDVAYGSYARSRDASPPPVRPAT